MVAPPASAEDIVNGAEALIRTAVACGVDTCFANPGTTEMDVVAALDATEGVRGVLALFEGVCSGAADGYQRVTGRPAMTLTHLGPGLANSIANLHNARRAGTPMINVVGDHATWHLAADAPLTSDIAALAGAVSIDVRTVDAADDVGPAFAAAWAAADGPPSGPATIIIRQDAAWSPTHVVAERPSRRPATPVSEGSIDAAADALRTNSAGMLLGGTALGADGLRLASRIAEATGARLLVETFPRHIERGGGLPAPKRLGYFPEQAHDDLAGLLTLVLVDADDPVAFFGYPDGRSRLADDATAVRALTEPGVDVTEALARVAERVGIAAPSAHARAHGPAELPEAGDPGAALDARSLAVVLARWLPENAVVVDESITSGGPFEALAPAAARHTSMALTGGAIGQGLPLAVGVAVGAPGRPVVALQADGSAAYTAQALWTMARERLDVTVVLLDNGSYRILQAELARAGTTDMGPAARSLTNLGSPRLDWVSLAHGYGVPATRVETVGELAAALERRTGEGPMLISAALA